MFSVAKIEYVVILSGKQLLSIPGNYIRRQKLTYLQESADGSSEAIIN